MNKGFSLLELMVSVAIFAAVAAGVLGFLHQGQWAFQAQGALNQSNEQARIAMDQIVRYLRHSGNDPGGFLEANLIPAVEIVGENEIRINSDMTGSVASTTGNAKEATGDPDGTLDSIHEIVTFRYDASSQRLYVDLGYGESILADRISDFQFAYFDNAGNPTSDSASVARVTVRMVSETRSVSLETGQRNEVVLHSEVFLRAKAFNPFEVADPTTTIGTNGTSISP